MNPNKKRAGAKNDKAPVVEEREKGIEQKDVASADDVVVVVGEAEYEVEGVVEKSQTLSAKMPGDVVAQTQLADIVIEAEEALGELKDEVASLETEGELPPEVAKGLEAINSIFPENMTDLDTADESKREQHREEISALLKYINEDYARALEQVVSKIDNVILRIYIIDDIIIKPFAAIDSKKAFAIYRNELGKCGVPADEIDKRIQDVEATLATEANDAQRTEKIKYIRTLMETDPVQAAKLWQENRDSGNYGWKELRDALEEKIQQTTDIKLGESVDAALEFYGGLLDQAPGLEIAASKIFNFVADSFPKDMSWEKRRPLILDRLASAPEIIAFNSLGYYSRQDYTNEERAGIFRQLIGKDRDFTLKKFQSWDLSDKQTGVAPDIKAALLVAYRKHSPGEIIRSGIFMELLPTFSEKEKEDMLIYVAENDPYSILRATKGVELSDNMKGSIANSLARHYPNLIFSIYKELGFAGLPDLYGKLADGGNFDRLMSEIAWRAKDYPEFVDKSAIDEIVKVVLKKKMDFGKLLNNYLNGNFNLDDEQIQNLACCGYVGSNMLVRLNARGKVNSDVAQKFLDERRELMSYDNKKSETTVSADQLLDVLKVMPTNLKETMLRAAFSYLEKLAPLEQEKKAEYFKVLESIGSSPSQEMQKIAAQLVDQILNSDFPLEAYKKIEEVFVKNNLPLVGKVYKIFEILNPASVLNKTLEKEKISPYLKQAGEQKRYATIFRDLLKVNIQSDNRSLRNFLETLQEGEQILSQIENIGEDNIESADLKKLKYFILKLNTLFLNTQLGGSSENLILDSEPSLVDIRKSYDKLKESLQVVEGQTVNQRLLELFAKPLGYKDITEVLSAMDESKRTAHERSLKMVAAAKDGKLQLDPGDLLKGVNEEYIQHILQNGSVAKEFLGASSDSDLTPLDTDVDMLPAESAEFGFKENLDKSLAKDYGEILFVVKNRGQYNITTADTVGDYDRSKLELFHTGAHGERHFGIRTGFPATEIDFVITEPGTKYFDKLCLEIVQNGYYIPVTDRDGKIIFTPEMYEDYHKFYDGLERFGGGEMSVVTTAESMKHYPDVVGIKDSLEKNSAEVEGISRSIAQMVEQVLGEQGVTLKDKLDMSILGAELMDTGSTGRHTNMPGGFDFDLVLRIDDKDAAKVPAIVKALQDRLTPATDQSYTGNGVGADIHQLRFFGAKNIGENPVDIDIAFVKKSGLMAYGSHDAVKDKLEWIKKEKGQDTFAEVVANIILTKKILKGANAYKKGDHEGGQGGLGGIGVENWILANSGNMVEAFKSFQTAAYDGGRRISLDEFKKKYMLIDPGINMKFLTHDNFVKLLTNEGYGKMLDAIDGYLAS